MDDDDDRGLGLSTYSASVSPVTGQLADATGDFACLVFVLLATSARPRVVQSASWQSASWRIRELSSNLSSKPRAAHFRPAF